MKEFRDKVAVVTGGSRGIGRAIALKMAEEGAQTVITYHGQKEAATKVVEEIRKNGVQGYAFQNDSGDFDATKELINTIKQEVGEIDYLVNNAGIGINKAFYMISEKDWDQVIETNLKGAFNFCRNVIFDFLKRKQGAIVNVSSVAGFKGLAGQASYCASKAGLINMTRSLAKEFGKSGIRINAVAPGYIDTDMTRSLDQRMVDSFLEQIPCRSFGDSPDVAEAVAFLLSSKSKYILGETIVVDGGLSL